MNIFICKVNKIWFTFIISQIPNHNTTWIKKYEFLLLRLTGSEIIIQHMLIKKIKPNSNFYKILVYNKRKKKNYIMPNNWFLFILTIHSFEKVSYKFTKTNIRMNNF